MKVYVAARFYDKEKVRGIYKILRKKGYKITADWTLHKNAKPYDKHRQLARKYAVEDIAGVKNCDVFIYLTNQDIGAGTSTELGAAIMSNMLVKKPLIYVVGTFLDKNFSYFHPTVKLRKTVEDVIEEL